MPAHRMKLVEVLAGLEHHYGWPAPPDVTDPFDMILLENVAYLVDDARRRQVWAAFKRAFGTRLQAILDAPVESIAEVIDRGGMHPRRRAEKVKTSAEIACTEFDGKVRSILALPAKQARRALQRFPGVGEPGADKILLFTKTMPTLALDSNGLRALLRLGFGRESESYARMYRSVQESVAGELASRNAGKDFDWLIAAHQLLRQHGQTLCKRSEPDCPACPLAARCPAAPTFAGRRRAD